MTADGTLTVSDADVSHYLAVCDTAKSGSASMYWVNSDNVQAVTTYTPPSISITNNTMTITCGRSYAHSYASNSVTVVLTTKIYYVGKIS